MKTKGLAFYIGELEKLEPGLLRPLTSTSWPRDIPVAMGGGYVEAISKPAVNHFDPGIGVDGLGRGVKNDIPMIDYDLSKDTWQVFNFTRILKLPYIDNQLMKTAGRSLEDILRDGLQLAFDKYVDENVYRGFEELGTTGLVNNPNIPPRLADPGSSGLRTWEHKTPDEILRDVNQAMTDAWYAAEFDNLGIVNHILIPPEKYALLVSKRIGEAGQVSVLTYLLENNLGKAHGIDLKIFPSRWCKGAGIDGTDRMMAYVNHKECIQFDITVPLTRTLSESSAVHHAYLFTYAAQVSEVQFRRTQTVAYYDGI